MSGEITAHRLTGVRTHRLRGDLQNVYLTFEAEGGDITFYLSNDELAQMAEQMAFDARGMAQ